MKILLIGLLVLNSSLCFAKTDEEIHTKLCDAASEAFPETFKATYECLKNTELNGSVEFEDDEFNIDFYVCKEESQHTFYYYVADDSISSGDSWIGEPCD